LARAASLMGARVTLVSGPVDLPTPVGVDRVDVIDAQSMHDAVMEVVHESDIAICCAAVADWRPLYPTVNKREKSEFGGTIELERTTDILAELGLAYGPGNESGPLVVGFAAESHDVPARGSAKRERKNAHFLIANKIGGENSAFGSDDNEAFFVSESSTEPLLRTSKEAMALVIMQKLAGAIVKRV